MNIVRNKLKINIIHEKKILKIELFYLKILQRKEVLMK